MLKLNSKRLIGVLKDFYTITNIRFIIFDDEFNFVLSYPENNFRFCEALRLNENENLKCEESDKKGCKGCIKSNEPTIYTCHAGLTEAVIPIKYNNDVIGYIMFGQVIPIEDYSQVKERLIEKYPNLVDKIDEIPIRSKAELHAAATVLTALTTYVMENHWIAPAKSEFVYEVDKYIMTHIQEKININDMADELRIGRTVFYSVAKDYLGYSPAEYVRRSRIAYSKELLLEKKYSITEIAYMAGFSDYAHFSRVFKEIVGISAREYLKGL